MRVLAVNMTLDPVSGGGTAERTFQLGRTLARLGVDCTVLTLDIGLNAARRQALGGRLVALPCLSPRYYLPFPSWRTVERAVAAVDIVHLMCHWTLINAMVWAAARRHHVPYAVCPAGTLRLFGRSALAKQAYNRLVGRRLLQQAAAVIAISPDETKDFAGMGIDPGRMHWIANGIDPEEYRVADDAGFRNRHGLGNSRLVLFVGRLNPIKGPDLLVEAFVQALPRIGDARLVMIGPDDGMRASLQAAARRSPAGQRIHFLGYLGGTAKSLAYHAADLLVIPSRQEAMSIVALEAGACGTPVVLTDRCGFDAVAECGGGRVVPATVAGLRRAMEDMLGGNADLAAMGQRLRAFVERHHTWDAIGRKHIDLFAKLLERRRQSKTPTPARAGKEQGR